LEDIHSPGWEKNISDKNELSAKDFWRNFNIIKAVHITEEACVEVL
jgi:hypothetical protein